jgi:hypothetical protein
LKNTITISIGEFDFLIAPFGTKSVAPPAYALCPASERPDAFEALNRHEPTRR